MTQDIHDYTMASLRYRVVLSFVFFIYCFAAEERYIYLVLMEGNPVAFHRAGSMPLEEGRKFDPNR